MPRRTYSERATLLRPLLLLLFVSPDHLSLFSSHRWKGKCTDVFCLGLFALFWVGMGIVCIIGFSLGNTSR